MIRSKLNYISNFEHLLLNFFTPTPLKKGPTPHGDFLFLIFRSGAPTLAQSCGRPCMPLSVLLRSHGYDYHSLITYELLYKPDVIKGGGGGSG